MVQLLFDLFLFLSTGIVVSCTVLYLFLRKRYQIWRNLGIPGPEPKILFGNTEELVKLKVTDPELNDVFYKRYSAEKYIGYYNLWQPMLLVRDLDLVRKILENDFYHFVDRPSFAEAYVKTDSLFVNIFTQKGNVWKTRRTCFSKLFTPKKLKDYFDDMQNSLSHLMNDMEDKLNEDLSLSQLVKKHGIRTTCMQMYGLDVSKDEERIAKFMESSYIFTSPPASVVLKVMASTLAPSVFNIFKIGILPASLYDYFADLTRELMSARAKNNIKRNDMLDVIIKMMGEGVPDDEKISFEEAVGHIFTFFQASYDTSVLTLCHIFVQLTLHPEIQERARQEVCSILNGSNTITYDHVCKMDYLDAVICETLRKYPPVGIIDRECTKPYKVSNEFTIPEGMIVRIPVASLQMDPTYYPQPEEFIPERFYKNEESNKDVWLPFGMGPKVCLGMRLAKMSTKLVLAKTLLEYLILPSEKMKFPMKFDPKTIVFTVKPVDGFWVRFQKRDHSENVKNKVYKNEN